MIDSYLVCNHTFSMAGALSGMIGTDLLLLGECAGYHLCVPQNLHAHP
jgi:hypothetical protein